MREMTRSTTVVYQLITKLINELDSLSPCDYSAHNRWHNKALTVLQECFTDQIYSFQLISPVISIKGGETLATQWKKIVSTQRGVLLSILDKIDLVDEINSLTENTPETTTNTISGDVVHQTEMVKRLRKPRVFIGSSSENLDVAYALQSAFEHDTEPTVWTQGVFTPSSYPLDDLEEALGKHDFGIFVFAPDDVTVLRQESVHTIRDNVIFEIGLFIGRYGRKRTFFVAPKGDFHLPTDFAGLIPETYKSDRSDNNLDAAIGPAKNKILKSILREWGSA